MDGISLIRAKSNSDPRGILSVIESLRTVPFDIRRIFYIYGMKKGTRRGGHAHRHSYQGLFAVRGKFSIWLDNGMIKESVSLESPDMILLIHPMIWVDIDCNEDESILMALASDYYDESEYVRSYDTFLSLVGKVKV